jgi:hypothetical protein
MFDAASQRDNENKIPVIIRISGYAFSRAGREKVALAAQQIFSGSRQAAKHSTMNFGLST